VSDEVLWCRLPATMDASSAARTALTGWLRRCAWPVEPAEDLLLAVNEAVANAAEHAYPAYSAEFQIELEAQVLHTDGQRHAVVIVTDNGVWRPPPADPGFRGRGLRMIQTLTQNMHLDRTPTGTRLRMTSRPVAL
jgi:anti-sigma regulatory factor (Ser/Thr protein kinase)